MQNGFAKPRAAAKLAAALLLAVIVAALAGCADPLVRGGSMHFDAGRYEEAAGVFEQAVARNPNDAEAHLWLARSYSELGRIEDAVREYERALSLSPSLASQVSANRRRYWLSQHSRGERLLGEALVMKDGSTQRTERLNQAAEAFENAARLAPEKALTDYQFSRLYEARGDKAFADKALEQAFRKAETDRDAVPTLFPLLKERAKNAANANRYAEAIETFEMALRLSPDDLDLMIDLATVHLLMAEDKGPSGGIDGYRKAADLLERVRKVKPADADVLYNLATVRFRLDQTASADSLIHRYLMLKPDDPDGYDLLAELARSAGRPEQAQTAALAARVLALKRPVGDPADWARRAVEKFGPGSDLGRIYSSLGVPDEVHTLKDKSTLFEVWFYFGKGRVAAFENGAAAGPSLDFRKSSL
jgi:tetratricopeptide (TPR) repeat protein